MGGFKSGAADDDWGSTETNDVTESTTEAETDATDTETEPTASDTSDAAIRSTAERVTQSSQRNLPWVLTRNSITDGREQTVQLHLQQSTVNTQRETTRTLEAALGEPVKRRISAKPRYSSGFNTQRRSLQRFGSGDTIWIEQTKRQSVLLKTSRERKKTYISLAVTALPCPFL